jgi:uncharacterized protein with FMN-binding domain
MRRALPVLAATAGGLALLANFHTTPGTTNPSAAGTAPVGAPTGPRSSSPDTTGSPATTTGGPSPPAGSRVVDGPVEHTKYGDVQVEVTLQGKQITTVQALELPNDRSRSRRISAEAGPILGQEALQAQSAHIDAVSGASYTSQGYTESLQGALDQANGR